jgi:hypothetical protein
VNTFVRGTLVERTCEYELYCTLTFRLADETTISIFDSKHRESRIGPISTQLSLGTTYNLLLMVRARHVKYWLVVPPDSTMKVVTEQRVIPILNEEEMIVGENVVEQHNVVQGKVLDPHWEASKYTYQVVSSPKLYERDYVLLNTAIGNLVVSRQYIEPDLGEQAEHIAVDGYMEWRPSRIDLLAVL